MAWALPFSYEKLVLHTVNNCNIWKAYLLPNFAGYYIFSYFHTEFQQQYIYLATKDNFFSFNKKQRDKGEQNREREENKTEKGEEKIRAQTQRHFLEEEICHVERLSEG